MTVKKLSRDEYPKKNTTHKKRDDRRQLVNDEVSQLMTSKKNEANIIVDEMVEHTVDDDTTTDIEFNDEHYPVGHETLHENYDLSQLSPYDAMLLQMMLDENNAELNATLKWCIKTYGLNGVNYEKVSNAWKELKFNGNRDEQLFPSKIKQVDDEPIVEELPIINSDAIDDLKTSARKPATRRPQSGIILEPSPLPTITMINTAQLSDKAAHPNARQSHSFLLKNLTTVKRRDSKIDILDQQFVMGTETQQFDVKPENRETSNKFALNKPKAPTIADWLFNKNDAPSKLSPLQKYKTYHRWNYQAQSNKNQWTGLSKPNDTKAEVPQEQPQAENTRGMRK